MSVYMHREPFKQVMEVKCTCDYFGLLVCSEVLVHIINPIALYPVVSAGFISAHRDKQRKAQGLKNKNKKKTGCSSCSEQEQVAVNVTTATVNHG